MLPRVLLCVVALVVPLRDALANTTGPGDDGGHQLASSLLVGASFLVGTLALDRASRDPGGLRWGLAATALGAGSLMLSASESVQGGPALAAGGAYALMVGLIQLARRDPEASETSAGAAMVTPAPTVRVARPTLAIAIHF